MKTGKLILLMILAQFSYGQNNVLNTWAFHEHSDTNIFLSIGALGRTVQSNITAGTWYDGTFNASKAGAFDLRDRELLNIAYSTPTSEIGFTTSLMSIHAREVGKNEFNGLLRGDLGGDTLGMNTLVDTRHSMVSHHLKLTKKLGHTIAQLELSGYQLNTYQQAAINGRIVRNDEVYLGEYTSNTIRYNGQLNYLGAAEDQLKSAMSWGDSVRITSIISQPLIPSLGFRLIHRPTEFTQFQLLVSGLTARRETRLSFKSDSVNFRCEPSGIPTYTLFSEENILQLNNQFEYRRNNIAQNDTLTYLSVIPLKAYLAYRVQIEPLLFLNFSGGYERYLGAEFYAVNMLAERKYQNDLHLQLGISTYIYNQTIRPNISAGVRTKLSEKLTLMAFSSATTSIPYLSYTAIPRWTNRYHLNATLQYQLL